jgi:hypothetical protein
MPAIPEPRALREKATSLRGDYCVRLGSPPSSELFGHPAASKCLQMGAPWQWSEHANAISIDRGSRDCQAYAITLQRPFVL